jgi:hypothetical protein
LGFEIVERRVPVRYVVGCNEGWREGVIGHPLAEVLTGMVQSRQQGDGSGTTGCFGVDWDGSEPRVREDFDRTSTSTSCFGVD